MKNISKEYLEYLYTNQNKNLVQIGKILNVSPSWVVRKMITFNIPRRIAGKYIRSEETRQKLSKSKSGSSHPNFGKKRIHGKRHWFQCNDGQWVSMRSTWEVLYATYLNNNAIDWKYESKTFVLSDGRAYTPDFYLTSTNEWVEVKGWLTPEHKNKIELWQSNNPTLKLILANRKYLTNLGIDLTKHWVSSKPVFNCLFCNEEYHRKYPSQRLCSNLCKNRFIANGGSLPKEEKQKRAYNGNQSGENNSSSKLTKSDVNDIREMKESGLRPKDIAKAKNTSVSNIYNILSGKSWQQS